MCDCFHLAFPNWHGSPGTGAGRRLKGPEPGVDDDSICEEASEVLEEERPRPQGSSPVNEYPVTEKYTDIDKQAEEDIYDPFHKSSSIKKGKRIGFGSFFEKRSSAKISQMEDPEGSESRVFVRTVKKAASEGLVVSGGGKEGIFIKEVKPDSPASKHLTVKEGDQILSATVYFDNISYEDALQILKHAQAYRMEMCLKRKRPASTASTLESTTDVQPDREERAGPGERGRKAQRRHDVRISWPKFSSLGKGRKAVFKRSHSTSEAEDEKRLEMSPSTSDTESPLKTKEDAEAKTKKAKMKLKKTGLRSKSVDPDERLAVETHTGFLEFVEKHHPLEEASSQPSPEKQESLPSKMPHIFVLDDQEKKESVRIQKECIVPYMPDFETEPSQHKAELISLDKTLKTTDITDSLADRGRHSPKRSPDGKKRKKKQRSELKVNIQGKEKDDLSPDSLIKSPLAPGISSPPQNLTASPTIARTPELSVSPDSKVGPKIISHTQLKEQQMAIDINTQSITGYQPTVKEDQKSAREEDTSPFTGTGAAEDIKELKADVLISNVGVQKKPPKMDSGKQWKERSILISDLERYGIRSRGPVADIGIARSHYVSSVNEVQTSMIDRSDASAVKPTDGGLYENILDINRPRTPTATSTLHSEETQKTEVSCKDDDVSTAPDGSIKESLLHIQPPLLTKDINKDISGQFEKQAPAKFKLPKMDKPDFSMHEPILKTDKEKTVTQLEIKDIKAELRDPTTEQIHIIESSHMNILPKREDIEIPGMEAIVPSRNIQMPGVRMTMDMQKIHDIKGQYSERDSASFKLPSADLSDIDLQQHITKTDVNAEKVKLTKDAGVSKPAEITLDVKGTVPTQGPIIDVRVPEFKIDSNYMIKEESKQSLPIFKLPRTEFPDADTHTPIAMTKIESSKITMESSGSKEVGYVQKAKTDAGEVSTEMTKIKERDNIIKLPKREDIEIPGMEASVSAATIQTSVKQSFRSGETDTTMLKTKTEIGEISSTKSHSAIKLPKVKHPDLDIHLITKTDISTEKSGLQLESLPTVLKHDINVSVPNAAGPKINLEAPKADTDVCGVSPEIDIKGRSLEATADIPVSLPSVDVLLKKPDIDREVPKVSADVPSVDVKLPEAELTVSGQAPSVDVKGPRVEVEGRDVDGQGSNFKMPRFGVSLSKVKAAGPDVDVTLPKAKLEAQLPTDEMQAPSVEGEVEITEKDVKGLDVKIKKPKISFPNIDFQKTEVKAPEAEITIAKGEISLPQASIEVKGSTLDTKFTDVDVKEDVAIGDVPSKSKVPRMKLPKFGATKGKVEGVDVSADINVPQVEAPSDKDAIEVKAPDTETEGMGLEVDKTKGKFKLPKVTMPDINVSLPKVSGPEINLKGPKVDTDVSVSKPETDIKGPFLEGTAGIPTLEPEGKVKFQMPHIKMPSFGISKPEVKGQELSRDQTLPSVNDSLKKSDMDIDAPKVSADLPSVDVKLPEAELMVSGQAPSVDIKGPSVKVEGPDVDGQESKFKVPKFGISFPKVKAAGPEISTSKPDVDITLPEATLETQLPSAKLEAPSVKGEVEIPEMDVKGLDVKIKKPKISFPNTEFQKPEAKAPAAEVAIPKGEISLPQASVEVKCLKVDMKSPDVDVKADAGIGDSPSEFKLPSIKLPKFGVTKGKIKSVDVSADINVPEVEVPSGEVAIEVKAPDTKTEGIGLEVDKTKGKFKLPKVTMPDINVSLPKVSGPEINLKGPKADMDVSVSKPETDIKGPCLEATSDIPAIEPEGKLKFQMPHIKMPSFGISKPELKGQKLSGDQTLPSVDVSLKKPNIDMEAPKVSADVPSVDVKLSEAELTVSGQAPSVDVKGSRIEVEGPDIDGQESKFKMPKFGMSFPKVKAAIPDISTSKPDVDIALPEAKLDTELPSAKLEAPSVEGEVEIPERDVKGSDVKIKKPKISLPKFGFSKTEVKAPELDITIPKGEISLPQASVEVKCLKVDKKSSDVDLKADAGIGDSPSEFKLPSIKLPKFGVTKGKIEGVDVSADINVPEVEVPSGEVAIEVKAPDTDTEGIGLEVDKTKGKFKLPKVTMPDINVSLPKVSGPEINLKGPKADTDVSVSKPETDIKGPCLEATSDIPAIEPEGKLKFQMPHIKMPSFGISKPELKSRKLSGDQTLPSVDISLKKPDIDMEAPKISADVPSVDVKLPEAELTVSGQAPSVDVKGPIVKVEGPDVDGQGSKFKMPKFGISFPKVKAAGPEISTSKPDVDVTLPEATLETQLPSAELEAPSVEGEVEIPEMDVKGLDVKIKKPKVSFPKFGFSKTEAKAPEAEVTIPKGEISLPQASVEVKGPKVDMKSPDVDVKAGAGIGDSPSKFTLPSMKLPKFGSTKGKVEGVDVSADINVPQVEVPSGEVAIEVKAPDTETEGIGLEVDKTKGKFKLPKVTMPDINVSLPKVSGPEINLKGPKTETDVSVSKPETDIKGPCLEATSDIPAIEPEGKLKFQMPHIKMPSFGISKPELKSRKLSGDQTLPSVDISLKKPDIDMEAPKISADVPSVDVKLPEAELTVSGQAPSVDVKGPSVKVEGPDVDGQGSKFKMPKFGISFPKVKAAGPEISTLKPDVDVTLPKATLETQLPSAELEAPSVEGEVEIPEMDVKGLDVKIKKPKVSFPKFGFSKTEAKAPEAEVTIPKGEISLPQASVEVKGPKVDMKSPDVDVKAGAGIGDSPSKFKLPSMKLPKFGSTKGKVEGVDVSADINVPQVEVPSGEVAIEVKAPDTETEGMGLEVDKTKGKFKLPKVTMPDINVSLPKVSGPEINLKGPKVETGVSVSKPETDIKGPRLEATSDIPAIEPEGKLKFQMPHIKMPSFGISKPELKSRKLSGDQTLPSVDISLKKPDIDMEAPKISADVPSVDVKLPEAELTVSGQAPSVDVKGPIVKVEGPDVDGQGSKFKMPKFGISFPKVKAAGPEISTSKPDVDVTLPEATLETQLPSAELEAPSVEGEVEIPEMDVKGLDVKIKKPKVSFPKFGFSKTEAKAPEAEVTIPKGEISLPQASVEVKGPKVDMKSPDVDVKAGAGIGDSPSKFTLPSMKLPKFGSTKGKVEGVDVSADINVPQVEVPSGEVAIEVKAPDTETEGIGLEVDKTKGKFKLPKVTMPDINVSLPKVSGPEINLKGPKTETDVSVSKPETDIKGPCLEATSDIPAIEPEGKLKFQMPHIKMPSFGISKPELKSRKLSGDQTLPSVDISLKKPDIDMEAPKISADVPSVDVKLPEAELTVSGQAPSVDVKGPSVKVEGPDVDGQGSKFKMPKFGISFPKVKAAGPEISTLKPDVDVTLPKATLETQLPSAELEAPSVEGEVEIPEMDVKGLDVKIKKPKVSFPKFGFSKTEAKAPEAEVTIPKGEISLPQASVEVKGPKVDMKSPDVDVKAGAGIGDSPSKFKLPSMKLPKFGSTKGKVEGVDVSADINVPQVEVPSGEVAIEVKAPDTETEGMGLEVDKTKGKFKLPKVTMPDINVSLPKVSGPEINLKGPKVETGVSVSKPETDIKGPRLEATSDIPAIEPEGKLKFQMPHIKMPSFGISKPELKSRKLSGDQTLPSVDISLKKPDIDMEAPKVSADVPSVDVKLSEAELTVSGQAPSVDVKGPSVKVEGPDIDGQGSKFKMPKFGISFPKVKAAGPEISTSKPDVDVTLPEATLETQLPSAELEAPSVEGEVEIPEMDVKGLDLKIKKPKISFPKFGFSKTEAKAPDAEVTIPKGEISLPQASVEVKGPKVDMKSPDVDVKADAGIGDSPSKFKLPSMKLPKFGSTKGKVEGVDVSADINVPQVEVPSGELAIEVKAPDTETEGMGLEVDKTKGKFKLPKVTMPDINVSLPKVSGPEINLKGPKIEMDVSVSKPETDIKGPCLEATSDIPAIEPEGKLKFQMPHIKMPSFGISKPELKSRKLSGDQTLPSVDISLKKPDIDMEAPKVSVDVPSVDVKLPEAELTVSGQAPSVDVKGPSVKVEGPDIDGQGSKFKMPKFGISFPKVKAAGPEISTSKPDVDVTLPEATLETQLPSAELEAPSVEGEVEIPEMDVKGLDLKIKKPKISFPKFGFSKTEAKAPEAEVTIPKGEISLPQASVEVKGPKVDMKSPDVDVKADAGIGDSPSKFKLPSMKLPKFGSTKGKVEGVDVSADINVPQVEVPSGELAIEVKAPDTETEGMGLEVDKTKGKFKLPKVTMPDINVSLPKVSGPEINLKGPKIEMDVSVSKPETDIKGPCLEATSDIPAIEPEGKLKFQMPHIKMPSFGISKPELKSRKLSGDQTLPSVDISLKKPDIDMEAPKVSADVPSVDVKLPEAELTVSGQAPSVDVKGPSVKVDGPDIDGQGSKFKMPKFGISFPKVKTAGPEISTSKPDVDVTLPEATLETQLPNAELEAPSVEGEVEIPEMDVKGLDVKIKKPKISFPKFGFSKTEAKAPEAEVTIPKGEISLPQASVEVKGPKVDMKSPDVDVKADASIGDSPSKFKLPSIKLPKFGVTKGKVEGVDVSADINEPEVEVPSGELAIEVKAPDTETEGMGLEVDKTKGKFKLPKVTMPDINVSLPKVSGPEINLKGPKIETDVSVSKPETDIKGPCLEATADTPAIEPEGKLKFQMPHIKMPSFGISKPELKSRKLSGDQTLPSVDISLKKPDTDMEAPKISADVPSVDVKLPEAELTVSGQAPSVDVKGPSVKVEGPDVDGQGSKFKMPKFGFSFPKVKAAGPEISTSKPDIDVTLPEATLLTQLPSAELEAPSVEGEVEIPEMDVKGLDVKIKKPKISFPKFGFSKTEAKAPDAEVTIPKGEISLPQASVEVKGPKVDMKSPDVDVTADAGIGDSPSKFKLPSMKLPKFGSTKGKVASVDVSADINVLEVEIPSDEVAIEVKAPDTELEGPTMTISVPEAKTEVQSDIPDIESTRTEPHTSPSKFKLPTFKMPKFSFSPVKRKPSDAEANVEKTDTDDKVPEITHESVEVDKKTIDVSTEKTSSFSLSFQKPGSRDMSPSESKGRTHSGKQPPLGSAKTEHHTGEISLEAPGAGKGHLPEKIKEPEKSSKFSLPSFGDIFKGLDLEFYVPTLEEAEQKRDMLPGSQEEEETDENKTDAKEEKGSWFTFPKFGMSSPSKTPKENLDKGTEGDAAEDISLTSSVKSSDAFADISSTITSEQVGLSETSPEKVTVKYSEPSVIVGVGQVKTPSDVITSTARTELIRLEPQLPDPVTVCVTSPSQDTLTDTGDIHIVTSNIQALPGTEHATIITKFETVETVPLGRGSFKSAAAPWTVEAPTESAKVSSGETVVVEKHVIKEKMVDDKGTIVITEKVTHAAHAVSKDPDGEDATSAVKKLKDSMHSEKMKFFDAAET